MNNASKDANWGTEKEFKIQSLNKSQIHTRHFVKTLS